MARGKQSSSRPVEEIAADLEAIAGGIGTGYSRALASLAAELRGEKLEPTPNEARAAERQAEREGDSSA